MQMKNVLDRLTELAKDNPSPDVKQAMENTRRMSVVEDADVVEVHEGVAEGWKQTLRKFDPTIKARIRDKSQDQTNQGLDTIQHLADLDLTSDDMVSRAMKPNTYFKNAERYAKLANKGMEEGGKTPKQYWNRDSQSIGSTPDDGLTYADPDEDGVHYPDYANTKDKNSRKFRVKDDDGVETTDSRYRVDPKTKKLKLQHRISIEKESVNQGVAEASKTKKTRNATTDFLGKYPLKPGEIATKVSTKKDNVKTDKQKDINESTDPLIRIKKLAGQ